MINAKLERYMTGLYALSHKISAFIYILNWCNILWLIYNKNNIIEKTVTSSEKQLCT